MSVLTSSVPLFSFNVRNVPKELRLLGWFWFVWLWVSFLDFWKREKDAIWDDSGTLLVVENMNPEKVWENCLGLSIRMMWSSRGLAGEAGMEVELFWECVILLDLDRSGVWLRLRNKNWSFSIASTFYFWGFCIVAVNGFRPYFGSVYNVCINEAISLRFIF